MGTGVTGTVHVIVPIDTLQGPSDRPGEVPGYGAVPASVARMIAASATQERWCYSIVDDTGRAIRHGHLNARTNDTGHRRPLVDITDAYNMRRAAEPGCSSDSDAVLPNNRDTYRPSGSLRHLIQIRDGTCRFPVCRRPAQKCDVDHTIPYSDGGPICACNLAPLCRKHHRLKQAPGWTLTQSAPGRPGRRHRAGDTALPQTRTRTS
jgi:hypothetical protein